MKRTGKCILVLILVFVTIAIDIIFAVSNYSDFNNVYGTKFSGMWGDIIYLSQYVVIGLIIIGAALVFCLKSERKDKVDEAGKIPDKRRGETDTVDTE